MNAGFGVLPNFLYFYKDIDHAITGHVTFRLSITCLSLVP